MIAVIGGAGIAVRVMMTPKEETYDQPVMGDTFDYSTLNVAAQMAQGDDVMIESNGSGFNIACHLAEMGKEVSFASVVGNDPMGLAVVEHLKKMGVDSSYIKKVDGTTPVLVEILNVLNDPQMVFGNSKLYESIKPEMIDEWKPLLEEAEAIVLDGNLPKESLEYLANTYGKKDGVKVFFDPAGYNGAVNSREILAGFYFIMPGRTEAEAMVRNTVLSTDQLMDAGRYFAEKGVDRIIITIKGGGLYYKADIDEGVIAPDRVLSFARTSGAGDIVSAAVVAADLEGKNIEEIGKLAMEKAADFLEDRSDKRMIDVINERKEGTENGC